MTDIAYLRCKETALVSRIVSSRTTISSAAAAAMTADESISTISKPYRPSSEDMGPVGTSSGSSSHHHAATLPMQLNGMLIGSRTRSPSLHSGSPILMTGPHNTPTTGSISGVIAGGGNVTDQSEPNSQVGVIRKRCCSKRLRKMVLGLLVTASVASSWVAATHFIKRTYLYRESNGGNLSATPYVTATSKDAMYDAPFITTWFCTVWTGLFFPLYMVTKILFRSEKSTVKSIYKESVRTFREKGFTTAKFFTRCGLFCGLWVATNYMYIHALRILDATDVMALYSSNVSFVYLLSWVILHEQFVGVRIVAVILCNTGIALLAYMDGLTRTPTLGGVILAAASSAGSAVYKVLFKKVIGEASFGQVSLFFTLISLFNTFLLWPLLVALYFTQVEVVRWMRVPWWDLVAAAGLSLVSNLLGNFGVALTYEFFITLGLIVAVPLSAALDSHQYKVKFEGMKLAGIILIAIGFLLVLFPDNWPDYVTRLLRWRRQQTQEEISSRQDTSTGGSRSRLRSPNGLVR